MNLYRLCTTIVFSGVLTFGADLIPPPKIFAAPAIGELPKDKRDALSKELGEEGSEVTPKGLGTEPWEHTYHHFGFIGIDRQEGFRNIVPAHAIDADPKLRRIDIRLDRLSVYDYPGSGRHFVLFTFAAQNSPTNLVDTSESITFSQTYEAEESEGAGITGYPVFNGLNVGKSGVALRCSTVNVKNATDEKALGFLKGGPVSQGLTLLTTAYPAVTPFAELTKSIGEILLTRNRNVKVQEFYLGLDFDKDAAFGVRLREGSYIVVQAPEDKFSWEDWRYNESDGRIVNNRTRSVIPFNYIVFRVMKHK
jgi:hypothetical protein